MEQDQETESAGTKSYNPNVWGLMTGAFTFVAFAITHFSFVFPDMLIHVFILPVIIGFLVRWQIKLRYTNHYRDE